MVSIVQNVPLAAPQLSPGYQEIKALRSGGKCAAAISLLRQHPPSSDLDAFEAVVCLFICGDTGSALHVCQTRAWKLDWAKRITAALTERMNGRDVTPALSLARHALAAPGVPYDASAIYLLLLREAGELAEAEAYIRSRLKNPPAGETFLLTIMAEAALSSRNWREAYRAASAVLSSDPEDYRALLALSSANFEIGNTHEALGNAKRASIADPSLPAILQLMRCQNKLGDYYGTLAAFDRLPQGPALPPDLYVELGTAYAGLGDEAKAITHYRSALAAGRQPSALRALIAVYAAAGETAELAALSALHREEVESDIECLYWLGLAALARRDLDEAKRLFGATFRLAEQNGDALDDLPWPIPEPRVRHDYEQLELLERRGKLDARGREAMEVLKPYYERGGDLQTTFAPAGRDADALKRALVHCSHVPDPGFGPRALGANDYGAIEAQYLERGLVVIDGFLAPDALAALRLFCEEATIWKIDNPRGYVGAVLSQGFSARVLLTLADELRAAMPQVIGDLPLLQAWGFKYDQRMQGINMHADFAKVNVNFWITPDEACTDPASGGLVVYDVPVPKSWTFADYNTDSEKLTAYLNVHAAKPQRVAYRANRCVLFDSSLIHISDEMKFRPGYEKRRINVTLLFGKARSVE